MKMMRVNEAVEALGGRLTERQIRYGIAQKIFRGAKIAGVVCVDVDSITDPGKRPLVSGVELSRITGLSVYQIRAGVSEGWIRRHKSAGKRMKFDPQEVLRTLDAMMGGGADDHDQRDPGKARRAQP